MQASRCLSLLVALALVTSCGKEPSEIQKAELGPKLLGCAVTTNTPSSNDGGLFGKHHRCVAGKIAMRGIARQLEDDTAGIEGVGDGPGRLKRLYNRLEITFELGENIHSNL